VKLWCPECAKAHADAAPYLAPSTIEAKQTQAIRSAKRLNARRVAKAAATIAAKEKWHCPVQSEYWMRHTAVLERKDLRALPPNLAAALAAPAPRGRSSKSGRSRREQRELQERQEKWKQGLKQKKREKQELKKREEKEWREQPYQAEPIVMPPEHDATVVRLVEGGAKVTKVFFTGGEPWKNSGPKQGRWASCVASPTRYSYATSGASGYLEVTRAARVELRGLGVVICD
jgi:hypothetical protein